METGLAADLADSRWKLDLQQTSLTLDMKLDLQQTSLTLDVKLDLQQTSLTLEDESCNGSSGTTNTASLLFA